MRLKEWMNLQNVKAAYLAKRLDVNLTTIYRYVSGDRDPGLAMAAKIRDASKGAVTLDDMAATVIERKGT